MRARSVLYLLTAAALGLALAGCGLDPMESLGQSIVSPDLTTRKEAVQQLANLNGTRAVKKLVDALQSDEQIADLVGVALVKKGRALLTRPRENPVVKQVAEVMKAAYVLPALRARAAWTLGEIGDRRAIADLKIIAADTSLDPRLITEAKHALEKLGYMSEGRQPDIAPDRLEGQVPVLPVPPPLAEPKKD